MNKHIFFLLLLGMLSSAVTFGQHDLNKVKSKAVSNVLSQKAITDTLQPASFATGTPVLYSFIDGGYCFGNNPMHDKIFAQKYFVPQTYLVYGVALWVGAKQVVGEADSLSVNFYRVSGLGTDTSGPVMNAPDTAFKSMKICTDMIDTSGLTLILFPDSFIAFLDYAVGIDVSAMDDDTIGLVTTTDGDALQSQYSWEQWSDHTWHSVLESLNWGMDLDFGIFIIADMSAANINDDYFIDGIKLSQNQPNPTSGNTLVQYELMNDAKNVVLEIYDAGGKLINVYNEGKQTNGLHQIDLSTENNASGIYYYSLKADGKRLTKRMLISN
jgi:hypothetical protein